MVHVLPRPDAWLMERAQLYQPPTQPAFDPNIRSCLDPPELKLYEQRQHERKDYHEG